jgi:hypothetical protein
MYIRHQTIPFFADLSVEWMEAFCALVAEHGIHAARCFAIGS